MEFRSSFDFVVAVAEPALISEDRVLRTILERNTWLKMLKEINGQDLVDYALAAGFLALIAGAISPVLADSIGQIYGKLVHAMSAPQGSSVR